MEYVFPSTQPMLHSTTKVPAGDRFRAFRNACEGGGTPPDWTQSGDDPNAWASPPDAAGSLILTGRYGAPRRAEPSRYDADCAVDVADDAAEMVGLSADDVVAAYFSCGGQGVFLIQCVEEEAFICVARAEDVSRLGVREAALAALGYTPEIVP